MSECNIKLITEQELKDKINENIKQHEDDDGFYEEYGDFLAITRGERSYSNFEELINLENYNNVTLKEIQNKHDPEANIKNKKQSTKYFEEDPLEMLLKLEPYNEDYYFLKAACLERLERYEPALKNYKKAIKLDPDEEKYKNKLKELKNKL